MTVSQMSLTEMTDSPQQQQTSLAEQVLNWSGLPGVHVRGAMSGARSSSRSQEIHAMAAECSDALGQR
jgi:hypothetical protein